MPMRKDCNICCTNKYSTIRFSCKHKMCVNCLTKLTKTECPYCRLSLISELPNSIISIINASRRISQFQRVNEENQELRNEQYNNMSRRRLINTNINRNAFAPVDITDTLNDAINIMQYGQIQNNDGNANNNNSVNEDANDTPDETPNETPNETPIESYNSIIDIFRNSTRFFNNFLTENLEFGVLGSRIIISNYHINT